MDARSEPKKYCHSSSIYISVEIQQINYMEYCAWIYVNNLYNKIPGKFKTSFACNSQICVISGLGWGYAGWYSRQSDYMNEINLCFFTLISSQRKI